MIGAEMDVWYVEIRWSRPVRTGRWIGIDRCDVMD